MAKTNFTEEDWARLERDWNAWWAHDLRRPMVMGACTAPTSRTRPDWWGGLGQIPHEVSAEAIADEVWDDLSRTSQAGDAWPRFWINYGPGVAAAFLGGNLDMPKGGSTVWFYPGIWQGKELHEIRPEYDADNFWWRRVQSVTAACLERFAGRAQVGFTDLGGNLDIAASLRETQELLMDCLDDPAGVDALSRRITPAWLRFYREQYELIAKAGRGTSAWAPLWSPGRTYMLQSDFSYMISPDLFARWVVPDLAACSAELDHAFYHLDGKGELPHVDHLLTVPNLKGVQWIPGDGQAEPGSPEWWPLLKRLRDAGKLVQIFGTGEVILRMAREVPLTGFAIELWDKENVPELVAAIQRANAELTRRTVVSL